MPYTVVRRDGKYCVYRYAGNRPVGNAYGCHPTRTAAQSQITALYASEGKAKDDRLDEVFRRYHELVNMSASELERWSETEYSKLASDSRAPIERNLRLLRKPKAEWTARDFTDANRTISFISRMRNAEQGKPVRQDVPYSKRDISLMNWAYNPKRKELSRRMFLITSNSYQDREGEFIKQKALEEYVRSQWSGAPGKSEFIGDNVLLYRHDKKNPIGRIIWCDTEGPFLLELAEELPGEFARQKWDFIQRTPRLGWGASHGFNFLTSEKRNGVYSHIKKFETTVLPLAIAANPYTYSGIFRSIENDDDLG